MVGNDSREIPIVGGAGSSVSRTKTERERAVEYLNHLIAQFQGAQAEGLAKVTLMKLSEAMHQQKKWHKQNPNFPFTTPQNRNIYICA